jgi:hypothetical protein
MAAAASQPTEAERAEARRIQAGIDQAMTATIADAVGGRMYSPFRGNSAGTAVPAGAARVVDAPEERGSGWREPQTIGPPPGIAAIDAIVEAHLPMPKPGRRITTAELVAETEAKLKELRDQLAQEEGEEKAAMEEAQKKGK